MLKYLAKLIKSTNEFRLETMEDVEKFHKYLLEEAENGGWSVNSYAWVEKPIKEGGEVVDSYFQVKTTLIFDELKDPINNFENPTYIKAGE